MCYDAAQLAFRIYKDAVRLGASPEEVNELYEKWKLLSQGIEDIYHTNGFAHQKLFAFYFDENHLDLGRFHWGLIPHWVKTEEDAKKISNHTINARGETIFEKPSFRDAAQNQRCILPLDGFYEHHHKDKRAVPFYIKRKDGQSLFVGAIVAHWLNKDTGELIDTFSMVTTKANDLLSLIHNNPKAEGHRMPLLLNDEDARLWMEGTPDEAKKLIRPNRDIELEAWTVNSLRGKNYVGNTEEAQKKHHFNLLDPKLFKDMI